MEQNEFETVDEACLEVARLRSKIKRLAGEMRELLYMIRTGATNEQLDYRVRNALEQYDRQPNKKLGGGHKTL